MTSQTGVRIVRLHDLIVSGDLDDYHLGPPPGARASAVQIDRDVAATSVCVACGQHGQEYRAFHAVRPDLYSYRAFTRCRACGHCEEF